MIGWLRIGRVSRIDGPRKPAGRDAVDRRTSGGGVVEGRISEGDFEEGRNSGAFGLSWGSISSERIGMESSLGTGAAVASSQFEGLAMV